MNNGATLNGGCSDGEPDSAASPDEDNLSDDLGEIDLSNLTPETSAKINEAKSMLQSLHVRATSGMNSGRFLSTADVADQVNRVLEEEGITRSALAKFVLHGPYKTVSLFYVVFPFRITCLA